MTNPILLQLGPVTIYYQGIFLTLGLIIATFLFWRRARREGFDEERILDLALVSLLCAFLGARLFFILLNFSVFAGDWLDAFRSIGYGLNFFGGLVFGLSGAWFFIRRQGWSFMKLADAAAPSVALGQAFGSLSILFSRLSLPQTKYNIPAYLILFVLLIFLEKQEIFNIFGKNRTGYLAGVYLFFSGLLTFVFEFWSFAGARGSFTFEKVTALLQCLAGAFVLYEAFFAKDAVMEKEKELGLEAISRQLREWLSKGKDINNQRS